MKLFLTVAITFLGVSHTSVAKAAKFVPVDTVSEQTCAESLYVRLSTYMSSTQNACSYGRTDLAFQDCAVLVAHRFGDDYVEVAGQACALSRSLTSASCATELYLRGGLYVTNSSQSADGIRICSSPAGEEIKNCIVEKYQSRQLSGLEAAKVCFEKFDPETKARKEAELRRIAELQRIAEQRLRQEAAQRASAEARRVELEKQRQDDLRQEAARKAQEARKTEELRKIEDARKVDASRKADEARKAAEGSNRAAEAKKVDDSKGSAAAKKSESGKRSEGAQKKTEPQPPPKDSGNSGGVIVDLPNFE